MFREAAARVNTAPPPTCSAAHAPQDKRRRGGGGGGGGGAAKRANLSKPARASDVDLVDLVAELFD
jgi:hypothetical protein